jgi:hypothetical protein
MGYYTQFEIECAPRVLERLEDVSGYSFEDTCKWYEYETDITAVSKEFPSEIITVTGYFVYLPD